MRIAIGYQSRVGKDTFADYICSHRECIVMSFAARLYKICETIQTQLGFPVKKDTGLLQAQGELLRQYYSPCVWVDPVIRDIQSSSVEKNIIITDVRHIEEYNALVALGFTMIKITRDNRTIDRDQNHISETSLANMPFDFIIENNGTIEEFYSRIVNPPLLVIFSTKSARPRINPRT